MKALELRVAPDKSAKAVSLRYVSEGEKGYSRQRKGKGFIYQTLEGKLVRDKTLMKREDTNY